MGVLKRLLLASLPSLLVLLAVVDPASAGDGGPPSLSSPFSAGQVWRVTCGYALPDDAPPDVCGHAGEPWNAYALDFQHAEGGEAATGQPIVAAADGRVERAGWKPDLGWHVILDHGGGYTTVYAHMEEPPVVRTGAQVAAGDTLGHVGCTGTCTGAHIHFALWKDYVSVLPEPLCGERDLHYGELIMGCAPGTAAPPEPKQPDKPKPEPKTFPPLPRLATQRQGQIIYAGPDEWWHRGETKPLWALAYPLTGDFNGDGRTDLAIAADQARANALSADESGDRLLHLASGDFDGSGEAGLALVERRGVGEMGVAVLPARTVGDDALDDWWQDGGYWPGRIFQVLAGDFTGDGRADMALLYGEGECKSRIDVLASTGREFKPTGTWWRSSKLCAEAVDHAALGDFDGDGRSDDIALASETDGEWRLDVLQAKGKGFMLAAAPWWAGKLEGPEERLATVLPIDFNADGRTDLVALYDEGDCSARVRLFRSAGDAFQPARWWARGAYCLSGPADPPTDSSLD